MEDIVKVTHLCLKSTPIAIYCDKALAGFDAAMLAARCIRDAIASRGSARVIIGTGPSQDEVIEALTKQPDINWSQVTVFHLDEYVGIKPDHSASFRRWLRERIVDVVKPGEVYYLGGDAQDLDVEVNRYAKLIDDEPIDVCFVGFGENGHIAFNDPHAADFNDSAMVKRIEIDERCRLQQVGEGHFDDLASVPREAISLTCSAIMKANHLVCVVPDQRKAEAVQAAVEGPLCTNCPASLVFTHSDAHVFLDTGSASLLATCARNPA